MPRTELNLIAFYFLGQCKWWVMFNINPVLFLLQAVVYEKPGFEGSCLEIDSDIFSFSEGEGDVAADGANLTSKKLTSVGSLKITGGLWVFTLQLHHNSLSLLAQDHIRWQSWLWNKVYLGLTDDDFESFIICKYRSNQQYLCTSVVAAGWDTASLGLRANSTSWKKESTWTAATGEAQGSSYHCDQYCLWVLHCALIHCTPVCEE